MYKRFFKLIIKNHYNRVVKIDSSALPMIHCPIRDQKIRNISKFGDSICRIFEIHYESCAFATMNSATM